MKIRHEQSSFRSDHDLLMCLNRLRCDWKCTDSITALHLCQSKPEKRCVHCAATPNTLLSIKQTFRCRPPWSTQADQRRQSADRKWRVTLEQCGRCLRLRMKGHISPRRRPKYIVPWWSHLQLAEMLTHMLACLCSAPHSFMSDSLQYLH